MNNFFEQFKKEAQQIRLTDGEKSAMRKAVFGMPQAPVPSPYVSHAFSLSIYFRAMVAAALVVVLIGGGTAYAAEGALPGQPLYAVKIHVNETVETALARTPAEKAQVHAALAQRRIEEAEMLVQDGTLDATVSAELAASFDAHARAAKQNAETLAVDDPASAAEIKTQIDSSLQAHGQILARLGETSASTSVRDNSGAIARAVLALAEREVRGLARAQKASSGAVAADASSTRDEKDVRPAAAMRVSTLAAPAPQATSSPSSEDSSGKIAAALQDKASQAFASLQDQYKNNKNGLPPDVAAAVDARLASTSDVMGAGAAALRAGDHAAAAADFSAALRSSIELSAYLQAQQKFKKNTGLLPQLLKREGGAQGESEDGRDAPGLPLIGE